MPNNLKIILLVLLLLWVSFGLLSFLRIHRESQKVGIEAEESFNLEQKLDVPSGVTFFNKRFSLENSNVPLIILYNEHKNNRIKYWITNGLKSAFLGPIYLIPNMMGKYEK